MTEDLALYVHWPFCESKCPYCDFNSHVAVTIDHVAWRDALLAELAHYAAETPDRSVSSLFFGGGTPSLMAPDTVAAIIEAIDTHWCWSEMPEITLEANPSAAGIGSFRDFRSAGVNRLSLGVQSLNDASLEFLGRRHDADEARRALADAAAIFERFTFDMIYALPHQTPDSWRAELSDALALSGDHLSVYQLTIEPGTPFFRDQVAAAPEDLAADLFDLTREILTDHGLAPYEVSNHARPGCESRHNLTYWRGGDYVGVGPGAHGRLTLADGFVATHQIHDPARWLAAVSAHGHGTGKRRRLDARERAEEMIMTGLRLAEGLDIERLQRRTGISLERLLDTVRLEQCVSGGLLEQRDARLIATEQGVPRLNAMLAALLAPDYEED